MKRVCVGAGILPARAILLCGLLLGLGAPGCARPASGVAHPSSVDQVPCEILAVVNQNSDVVKYYGGPILAARLPVLWDERPNGQQACSLVGGSGFVRSLTPHFDSRSSFIAIEKFYYDNDAAFLEIYFPPSGKNAEFFMRKRDGRWLIVEKMLWEN
ncbi:MAG TPA: hypothetical protein VD865_11830 [Stenotrophomonas sp.]|nr:hypothetical protein [Stenotrophomonas sp.]